MRIAEHFVLSALLAGAFSLQSAAQNRPAVPATGLPANLMPADARPTLAVATIKPSDPNRPSWTLGTKGDHLFTLGTNMNDLISFAYDLHAKQIVSAPEWFSTDKFDIEGVPDAEGRPNRAQLQLLLQDLLADRFKLVLHRDEKELSVYSLTLTKNGPRLTRSASTVSQGWGLRKPGMMTIKSMTMAEFASVLQRTVLDRPVLDRTGLTGRFTFTLNWKPDPSQFNQLAAVEADEPPANDDPGALPGLYTAIQEQLGLKLEPTKGLAEVVVIDRAEKPSAN